MKTRFFFTTLPTLAMLLFALLNSPSQAQLRPPGKGKDKNDGNGIYKKEVDTKKIPPKVKFKKGDPKAIKGQYIVLLAPEIKDSDVENIFKEMSKQYGIKLIDEKHGIWIGGKIKGFACYADEKTAEMISKDTRVDSVAEDIAADIFPTLPEVKKPDNLNNISLGNLFSFGLEQFFPEDAQLNAWYHLTRVSIRDNNLGAMPNPLNTTYNYNNTGEGVRVYVIDTGLKTSHEEFNPLYMNVVNFAPDSPNDCSSHGTAVTSVLAGRTLGVAKKVKVMMCRVQACSGVEPALSSLIAAVNYIRNDITSFNLRPAIVNMSFYKDDPSYSWATFDQAVYDLIHQADVLMTSGVPYFSTPNPNYNIFNATPQRVSGVVNVGGLDSGDYALNANSARYMPNGPGIDIYAPGGVNYQFGFSNIKGVKTAIGTPNAANNAYTEYSIGTSVSAPILAGIGAMYLESSPYSHFLQVYNGLITMGTQNLIPSLGMPSNSPNLIAYSLFGMPTTVNAANYWKDLGIAPNSLVSLFGSFGQVPTRMTVEDDFGNQIDATMTYAGTFQVNASIPATVPDDDSATIRLYAGTTLIAHGTGGVYRIAPGFFSANSSGTGQASGELVRVNKSTSQQTIDQLVSTGNFYDPVTENAYLVLYGTGFRAHLNPIPIYMSATIGTTSVPITYAGAQGQYIGLDQMNIGPLPANLKGQGMLNIKIVIENLNCNIVQARFL